MKTAINVNSVNFEKQQSGVVVMHMLCDDLQYNIYMLQRDVLKAAKAADRGKVAAIEVDIEAMGFEMHGITMIIDFEACSIIFKDGDDVKIYASIGCIIDALYAVKDFINSLNNKTEKCNDADTAVEDFVKRLIDNFGIEVISTISSIKSVKDDKEYNSLIKNFIRDINNM